MVTVLARIEQKMIDVASNAFYVPYVKERFAFAERQVGEETATGKRHPSRGTGTAGHVAQPGTVVRHLVFSRQQPVSPEERSLVSATF